MKEITYVIGTGEETEPTGMTIDCSNGKDYSVTYEINASGELLSVNRSTGIDKDRKHDHRGLKKSNDPL